MQVKKAIYRYGKLVAASVLAAVVLAEVAVRLGGLVDFPVYDVNPIVSYMPKASQSGNFMHKNDWVFNDRAMGVAADWDTLPGHNLLLIGNSIVMGGNPYRQQDKIGPLLQRQLGQRYAVWPIAAGGWTSVNQVAYLQKNSDLHAKTDFFVWEFMSGGFSGASQWRGDYVFPHEKPLWASWYIVRRYILPRFISLPTNELPPQGEPKASHVAQMERQIVSLGQAGGRAIPGMILLYPSKEEYLLAQHGKEWLPERQLIERICAEHHLLLVDVAKDARWSAAMYREDVHPNVAGNVVLAAIILDAAGPQLATRQ